MVNVIDLTVVLIGQMNPFQFKKSTKSGLNHGFWLSFFFNSTFNNIRIMVHIHNHTEVPANIYQKGHFIQSGTYNYLNVKRTHDQK